MRFPFYIAKRYLVAKKSQNAIHIISLISVISVAIGTFALVVVLSAFNGLEGLVESLFESFDSDIKITAKQGKVFSSNNINWEELSEVEGVKNYTKVLEEVCGLDFRGNQTIATIKGVEDSFLDMSKLDSSLIEGEAVLQKNGINYALIGYGIASSLNLVSAHSIENLAIYTPKRSKLNTVNPSESVYRKFISPAGVFYISPEFDFKYVVVPLGFAKELLHYDSEISAIEIQAKNNIDLEDLKNNLAHLLGEEYDVKSRFEFNEIIYKTNKTEKWVTFLILVFILIIASFNILSSLSMLIIDKKKDIKTLSSLGASQKQIRQIFFIEGLLINSSGALLGLFLGVVVCLLQQHVGLLRLEGGIVEYYPVKVKAIELVYILITVFVIGFLTSWYPVRKLTK